MHQSLKDIKKLRKRHDIGQKELANLAGVSQSLIAKIESGKVEPTFSKAQQIFKALESLEEKEEKKAKELMQKNVSFVEIDELVTSLIKIMKKKGISQVPVLSNEKVCGIITEKIILQAMIESPEKMAKLKVGDIMEDAPPIVSLKTGFKILSELLRDNPIVLVNDKGDIKGVISKSDLLGKLE